MAKITTALFGTLALLPYQAEAPVSESLEWLTDLFASQNANEDTYQLRTVPRQQFDYTIPLQANDIPRAFNTGYGALRQKHAVPIWTEAQYVGTVAAGATSLACDTDSYDLRANSLALLYRPDGWQLLEISAVASGSITFTATAGAIIGAFLVPLRLGYIASNIAHSTSGYKSKFKVSFDIEDNLALTPSAPDQYLSKDIYFDPTLMNGNNIDRSIEQRNDIRDNTLGVRTRRSPWVNARYGSDYRSLTTNAAEMRAYKNFLYRRAGRARDFWMPTFEQNVRPVDVGTVVSTLTIERDSFDDYTFRPHIAIEDSEGNWYSRAVSNPTPIIGDKLQLTLSAALNLDASLIRRISYLGLHRFDSDRVEISHIGNNVAECNVRVLELTP